MQGDRGNAVGGWRSPPLLTLRSFIFKAAQSWGSVAETSYILLPSYLNSIHSILAFQQAVMEKLR